MITEDFVSFETAMLLKEKGFNEKCTHYYKNEKYLVDSGYANIHSYTNSNLVEEFTAPTLQMVMKWLREVYNCFISIEIRLIVPNKLIWCYKYYNTKKGYCRISSQYKTYEEACEAAIRYCLKNLI